MVLLANCAVNKKLWRITFNDIKSLWDLGEGYWYHGNKLGVYRITRLFCMERGDFSRLLGILVSFRTAEVANKRHENSYPM